MFIKDHITMKKERSILCVTFVTGT